MSSFKFRACTRSPLNLRRFPAFKALVAEVVAATQEEPGIFSSC